MKISQTSILVLLFCIVAMVSAAYPDDPRDLVKERLNRRLNRNRYGDEDDEVGGTLCRSGFG